MKQIQKAIQDRHEKELKQKQSLEKAYPSFLVFREAIMRERRIDHEHKTNDFIDKKTQELRVKIVDEAKAELKKIENLRRVKEADDRRREKDLKIAAERRAQGIPDEVGEDDPSGWNKGT